MPNNFINISNSKFNKIIDDFEIKGYANLGKIITEQFRKKLIKRTKDLMMGNIKYKNMFFKLDDPDGNYFNIKHEDIKNEVFSGPSERYKKIKDLEYDPLFLKLIKSKSLRQIATKLVGNNVASMRSMILNKSYIKSSILPFHQDVSENWPMTGKPKFTLWLALSEATKKKRMLAGNRRFT